MLTFTHLVWTKESLVNIRIPCIIVNAANKKLSVGGGVCGAIHRDAGPTVEQECKDIIRKRRKPIPAGGAVMTGSGRLKHQSIQHIIHAVGPIWHTVLENGEYHELLCHTLSKAYTNALNCMYKNTKYLDIVFPLISTGIYAFPTPLAYEIAVSTCKYWLLTHPEYSGMVILSAFDATAVAWFEKSGIPYQP